MTNFRLAPIAVLPLVFLVACGGSDRSSRLLESPELQSVVGLQTARDGRELADLLTDRNASVRSRAALALASVQDQGAAPALISALGDDDPVVRAQAAFALGQLPQLSSAVETALIERLRSEAEATAQRSVAEALGKVGRRAASDALARVQPAGALGADATLALARLLARGELSPAGLDALIARLTDGDAEVRQNAAWGFANAFQPGLWRERREEVYRALDGYAETDAAAAHLLRALGSVPERAARGRLIHWLGASPDWRIRAAAADGLTGSRTTPEQTALLAALTDSSTLVRIAAASALAAAPLGQAELDRVEAWVAAHMDDPHVAGTLALGLALGGRARPVLAWIRASPGNDRVRWRHAVEAAAVLPGDDAIRVLAGASRSEVPAIAGAAQQALALRWVQGDRGSAAASALYYDAFVDGLRGRDPVTAPLLAEVLTDAVFRGMGSAAVLSEVGAVAEPPPLPFPALDWTRLGELGPSPRLTLETERGTIVIELLTEEAPATVQSLARLAGAGRLDGVPFHRVVPNFMVQGGDVTRGDGLGDPGFRLPSELTHLRYLRGTLGMARLDKDSETSQFFITQSMQPHLDGGYTAFGRVVEGLDVVDGILEGDRIVRARVEPGARAAP